MNRRALVTGAAALAASSVVPASLGAVNTPYTPEPLEFVRRVRALDTEAKVLLATLFRASPAGQDHRGQRLADLVEELGREEIQRRPL